MKVRFILEDLGAPLIVIPGFVEGVLVRIDHSVGVLFGRNRDLVHVDHVGQRGELVAINCVCVAGKVACSLQPG